MHGQMRTTTHRTVKGRAPRGLTFIEVMMATMLLVGFASIVVGAMSFLEMSAIREKHRLQGTEVAHRLIVQYLDDKDNMPSDEKLIQQGENYYRYTLVETSLQRDDSESGLSRRRARRVDELTAEQSLLAMLNRVTVTVYLDDPASPVLDARFPVAQLSRTYNPVSGRARDVDETMRHLIRMVGQVQLEEALRSRQNGTGSGSNPTNGGASGTGGAGGTGGGARRPL